MRLTGQILYSYFRQKVNESYTNFTGGVVKANRLFADAFLAIAENRFQGIEGQKYRDEISYLIQTGQTFSLNSNQLYTAPLQITFISFQAATATIQTYLPHNLITGDTVSISEVQLSIIPNINTTFTATVVSSNVFTIPFVRTSGTYTADTGVVVNSGKQISDYWQMIQVSAQYSVLYDDVNILTTSATTPVKITLDARTNIRTKMKGTVSTVGTVYFKKLNDFQFFLYSDEFLRTPTVGTVASTGGTVSQTFYNPCKPFLPKTNISPLGDPTPDAPKWKDSRKMLKFHPLNYTCSQITIDYLAEPDVLPDAADNNIDLTNYFSSKFWEHFVDVAAKLFGEESRDVLLIEEAQQNIVQHN